VIARPTDRETFEALRRQAEHLARNDPSRLPSLYRSLGTPGAMKGEDRAWVEWIIGSTQHLNGRTGEALERLTRAARIFRLRGKTHLAARVDLSLMDALACSGRPRAARRRGRRALEDFRMLGDRDRMTSALLNLGGIEDSRDRLPRALDFWYRAREIASPRDYRRRGLIETSIAGALIEKGRFREAERAYRRARGFFESSGDHLSALLPRLGLAEISAWKGDAGKALNLIAEIRGDLEGKDDPNLEAALELLNTEIEIDLGEADRALERAGRLRRRSREIGRPDDEARFAALEARAAVAAKTSDNEDKIASAEDLLKRYADPRALAVFRIGLASVGRLSDEKILQRDAVVLKRSGLSGMAELGMAAAAEAALEEGRRESCRKLSEELLSRRPASPLPRIRALRLLAALSEDQDPAQALRHLRRLLRLAEGVRGRLSSRRDREYFTAGLLGDYERLIRILLRRGDSRSRRAAFEAVSRVKSRGLVEALSRDSDAIIGKDPAISRRWEELRSELSALLAALEGPQYGEGRFSGSAVKERVGRITRELEDLELEAARANPLFEAVVDPPEAPGLAALLEEGEIFLETFFCGEDLILFARDRRGLDVRTIAGCRGSCEDAVEEIRFQLSRIAYGRKYLEAAEGPLLRTVRHGLRWLGDLLLAPLEGRPTPTRLWFAPHGCLHHLPVAALEDREGLLIEKYPVAIVPGSDILKRILMRTHHKPVRLGIAGADAEDLPEIRAEIRDISALFEGVDLLPEARKKDVEGMLARCDAVHLASHGAFQPRAAAGSGFRLSDGWLTVADLLRSPPAAHMMTCGVCASGEVDVRPGEETMGIIRALLAGGVSTALLAPGVLDDGIGRKAASLYYSEVFNSGPGEAFQKTLTALRREHPHPALWASLQLYGNSRPWETT